MPRPAQKHAVNFFVRFPSIAFSAVFAAFQTLYWQNIEKTEEKMKRMLCTVLLLFCVTATALGEGVAYQANGLIDLIPYAVSEPTNANPYGEARVSLTDQGLDGEPSRYALIHDGQVAASLLLPDRDSQGNPMGYGAFVAEDGRIGVISHSLSKRFRLYWLENGQLKLCAEEADVFFPHVLRSCLLAAKSSQPLLQCWNLDGTLRFSLPLPYPGSTICDAMELEDGSLLLGLYAHAGSDSNYVWQVLQLSAQGETLLQATVSDRENFNNDNRYYIASDGLGGCYFFASRSADYMQTVLQRLDASGARTFYKILRADKAIVDIDLAEAAGDGNTRLYGTVVANSRGLFRVFDLTVSPEGEILSRDIRDFTTACGYNYEVENGESGKVVTAYLLHNDAYATREWFQVPFDALVPAGDPGLVLE